MSEATALKERLRADRKAAMRARAGEEVGVLRALIAALDNAEAIPVPASQPANARMFGDPAGEVARQALDIVTVETLLAEEIASREAAAADYMRHGRVQEAERLRSEVLVIARYRA